VSGAPSQGLSSEEKFAAVLHIALNRLEHDRTRLGIQNKGLKAARDARYFATLSSEDPGPLRKRQTAHVSNISSG